MAKKRRKKKTSKSNKIFTAAVIGWKIFKAVKK
jgi:hypothetical protein